MPTTPTNAEYWGEVGPDFERKFLARLAKETRLRGRRRRPKLPPRHPAERHLRHWLWVAVAPEANARNLSCVRAGLWRGDYRGACRSARDALGGSLVVQEQLLLVAALKAAPAPEKEEASGDD